MTGDVYRFRTLTTIKRNWNRHNPASHAANITKVNLSLASCSSLRHQRPLLSFRSQFPSETRQTKDHRRVSPDVGNATGTTFRTAAGRVVAIYSGHQHAGRTCQTDARGPEQAQADAPVIHSENEFVIGMRCGWTDRYRQDSGHHPRISDATCCGWDRNSGTGSSTTTTESRPVISEPTVAAEFCCTAGAVRQLQP